MRGTTISGIISGTLAGRSMSTPEALLQRERCCARSKVIVAHASGRAEVYLPPELEVPARAAHGLRARALVGAVSVVGALAAVVTLLG